ncbi:transposable element Tcb1 transposase [Trichonephila clavipes]|nr:transposable element Tcb1 transposase [Trichonephila clavipes]
MESWAKTIGDGPRNFVPPSSYKHNHPTLQTSSVRCSLVIKVIDSFPACHEFEPSSTEGSPCGKAMIIKFVEIQTFYGMVWMLVKRDASSGHHQMARIRHNDESVTEGYIRNGGKEVKLFTSALKTFQCNNRIVMAQRKHLDDFLRGRITKRLECGHTQLEVSEELGIAQSVISRL